MSRLARRVRQGRTGETAGFDARQWAIETALRGRSARKARAHVRRLEPVVVFTPRWSSVGRFMDDLAIDLAVGEPAIGCRSVSFQPLRGRPLSDCWQYVHQTFAQLGQRDWVCGTPRSIADRRGFQWALEHALESAHQSAHHRVALLAHGAECLPLEVLQDLAQAWSDYAMRHAGDRRATILLAGSASAPWLEVGAAPKIALADYAPSEAVSFIVGRAGPLPVERVERAVAFSGGVPAVVEQLGDEVVAGRLAETEPHRMVGRLGAVGDEIRQAVDLALSHDHLADRLHQLARGEPLAVAAEVDSPLVMAGLVRTSGALTEIRGPVFSSIIG